MEEPETLLEHKNYKLFSVVALIVMKSQNYNLLFVLEIKMLFQCH